MRDLSFRYSLGGAAMARLISAVVAVSETPRIAYGHFLGCARMVLWSSLICLVSSRWGISPKINAHVASTACVSQGSKTQALPKHEWGYLWISLDICPTSDIAPNSLNMQICVPGQRMAKLVTLVACWNSQFMSSWGQSQPPYASTSNVSETTSLILVVAMVYHDWYPPGHACPATGLAKVGRAAASQLLRCCLLLCRIMVDCGWWLM